MWCVLFERKVLKGFVDFFTFYFIFKLFILIMQGVHDCIKHRNRILKKDNKWKFNEIHVSVVTAAIIRCKANQTVDCVVPENMLTPLLGVVKLMVKSETRRDTKTSVWKSETKTKHARIWDQNKCTTNEMSRLCMRRLSRFQDWLKKLRDIRFWRYHLPPLLLKVFYLHHSQSTIYLGLIIIIKIITIRKKNYSFINSFD